MKSLSLGLCLIFLCTYSYELHDISSEEYIDKIFSQEVLYPDYSGEAQKSYPGTINSSINLDYDNDGDQDLFITYQDQQARLFENVVISYDGTPVMVDVTDVAFEISDPQVGISGINVADYDNDGDMDIFAVSSTDTCFYINEYNAELHQYVFKKVEAEEDISLYASNLQKSVWGNFDKSDLLVMLK